MTEPEFYKENNSHHQNKIDFLIDQQLSDLEDAPTNTLKNVKQSVKHLYEEIEEEIIHRSEDTIYSTDKKKASKKIKKEVVEDISILVTVNREHIDEVIRNKEFTKKLPVIKYKTLFSKYRWVPSFFQKSSVKVIASIIPTIVFGVITLGVTSQIGEINSFTLIGILIAGLISIAVSVWIFRLFSQAQKFIILEKINSKTRKN